MLICFSGWSLHRGPGVAVLTALSSVAAWGCHNYKLNLSTAGGHSVGVVAALGYQCAYLCVKVDVRNEYLQNAK